MEKSKFYNLIITALKTVVVFALTAAFFLIVYEYDNKYTFQSPQASNGVLVLDDNILKENPVIFLVKGWEYYSHKLLTPKDFTGETPIPNQYMFIGEFGGFEKYNGGSPHGYASYRMNIRIPDQTNTYMLELPEIFSSYRLYINGKQVAQMGEPELENYQPKTSNRSISFEAKNNLEILFAVSDYSHFYSGMVYPPAFGQPEEVTNLLSARLVFRSLICAVALTIGLLSFMVGLLGRKHLLTTLFGLMCLFFVGYISYPIIRALFTDIQFPYVVENISFCAMLCIAMIISIKISGFSNKWEIYFVRFGGLMCLTSALIYSLIPLGNLKIMTTYSNLVSAYEWITTAFILYTVYYAFKKNIVYLTPMLYGVIVFVCALLADRLLPLYEPIYFGWFIELASFALVLCIGVVIGQDIATQYRESAVLTERANSMERLYKGQQSHFQTLKQEMEQSKTLRHDIRHHLTVISQYVQEQQYDKLEAYVKEYSTTSSTGELPEYCPIDVINILTHHYKTVAMQNNIIFDIRCDLKAAVDPTHTKMSDADLCCLYANLMENAVEACLQISAGYKEIRVAVFRTSVETLHIHVRNTAHMVLQNGNRFISTKVNDKSGYGLMSVESITKKYDGKATFKWNKIDKEFESKLTVIA